MVFQTPVRAAEFKSAYGPKYAFQPNLKGWNKTTMFRTGLRSAPFGGAVVVGLLFYVSGIPRVKEDILQKIPFAGRYFVKAEIHPQDNDEVFHIPQAQRYCEGRLLEWDDKITTPPGLYLFSILLQNAANVAGLPWLFDCGASALRFTNVLGLMVLAYLALRCRHEIESRPCAARSSARPKTVTTYAIHTAVNIALFPLLFFFSALYYTDVISTAVVVAAFLNHLKRVGRDRSSWISDVVTAFLGIAALSMRQTNVFWIVVWMGGLEVIHAIKTLKPECVHQPSMATLGAQLKFYFRRSSVGDVYDPSLGLAWPDDMFFTVISFGIAALCNPVRLVRQIWPYISVLSAFLGFVVWNGGVVLAIVLFRVKSRHSSEAETFKKSASADEIPKSLPSVSGKDGVISKFDPGTSSRLNVDKSSIVNLSPALRTAYLIFDSARVPIWILYLFATLAASAVVVKFNTIVHPFTLADNRHYMFYIFRHSIRRSALVRFLLIIPYTLSRWMVWGALAGCPDWMASTCNALSSFSRRRIPHADASQPFWTSHDGQKRPTNVACDRDTKSDAAPTPRRAADGQHVQGVPETDPLAVSCESISTSTGLVFLLATTLSLMTAPLVEPRYFIIPWVMWRLLVPAWRLHNDSPTYRLLGGLNSAQPQSDTRQLLLGLSQRYDLRLSLETIWLLAINVATGYIFLTKPYIWKDENGEILDGGRLQRFMW
ncbi:hypothetical protein E4U21_006501 [Claviceps maximensis]|nr:hypothetical protein E4U21_006501 [Claviceps maximensis]